MSLKNPCGWCQLIKSHIWNECLIDNRLSYRPNLNHLTIYTTQRLNDQIISWRHWFMPVTKARGEILVLVHGHPHFFFVAELTDFTQHFSSTESSLTANEEQLLAQLANFLSVNYERLAPVRQHKLQFVGKRCQAGQYSFLVYCHSCCTIPQQLLRTNK